MHDDNLPPDDAPMPPPAPMGAGPADEQKSLSLMPDQIAALGLDSIEPGKTYTIQLQASDASDLGQNFSVISAMPDDTGDADDGAPGSDAGDSDAPPPVLDEPPGAEPPPEEGGAPESFMRKKKPREGLPDTKKMRDL